MRQPIHMPSSAVAQVIHEVDSNGDGSVSLNEFIKWYATTWEDPVASDDEDCEAA